jgi:membrane protein DedA with SNARE-associated domain
MIDLWVTLSIVVAALVQDSITCVVTGVLLAEGRVSLGTALVGCWTGVLLGDLIWVSIGRLFSLQVIVGWLGERISSGDRALRWRAWMRQHRLAAVFLSRFSPGLQVPLHLLNGYLLGGVRRSIPAYMLAATVYVAVLVGLAFGMAESANSLMKDQSSAWILFAVGLAAWIIIHLAGRTLFYLFRRWIRPLPGPAEEQS